MTARTLPRTTTQPTDTRLSDPTTLEADLTELGFREVGQSRGRPQWAAGVNRYLQFTLYLEPSSILLTWRFGLGDFMLDRGWQIGGAESASQELYPQRDVRLPADADAVAAEVRRTLGQLQLDLGDPGL